MSMPVKALSIINLIIINKYHFSKIQSGFSYGFSSFFLIHILMDVVNAQLVQAGKL